MDFTLTDEAREAIWKTADELEATAFTALNQFTNGYKILKHDFKNGAYIREYVKNGVVYVASFDFWTRTASTTETEYLGEAV